MEIQVTRFREILNLLSTAVPKKSTLKALSCICVKDKMMYSTDLETFIMVEAPEADGEFLIPFAQVSKMIQFTHGGETLKISGKRGKVTLAWSEGKYTLPTEDFANFPAVPAFEPTVEEFLDMDTMIPAMVAVLPYTARETDRPVLNGVSVSLGKEMVIAAGDGHRMGLKTLQLPFKEEHSVIIPKGSVNSLEFLWKKTQRTPPLDGTLVSVIIAKKHAHVALNGKQGMRFRFGEGTTVIVKLVEGSSPSWGKIIPKEDPIIQVQFFAAELERAIKRISASGATMAKLSFREGLAVVSAKAEDQEMESTIPISILKGGPNEMGLSPKYLLDYLKGKEGVVTLSWVGGTSPVGLSHGATPRVLIMPMKLDEKKEASVAAESKVETSPDASPEPPAEAKVEAKVKTKVEAKVKTKVEAKEKAKAEVPEKAAKK